MTARMPSKQPRKGTKPGDPQSLGKALTELFALKGYAKDRSSAELAAAWTEIAGERIAARTTVLGIHRGVLQVAVVSSAMMNELASFHKDRLLEALQSQHPDWKIKGLKFRLRGDLAKRAEG